MKFNANLRKFYYVFVFNVVLVSIWKFVENFTSVRWTFAVLLMSISCRAPDIFVVVQAILGECAATDWSAVVIAALVAAWTTSRVSRTLVCPIRAWRRGAIPISSTTSPSIDSPSKRKPKPTPGWTKKTTNGWDDECERSEWNEKDREKRGYIY